MLRPIGAALAAAMAVALSATALAAPAVRPAERELLGVRIWRDFASVLKRHGAPTRVVPGIAMPPTISMGSIGVSAQVGQTGGMAGGPMMGPGMMAGGPMMGPGMMGGGPMMGSGMMGGGPMMGGMASSGAAGRSSAGMSLPGGGRGMTAPGGPSLRGEGRGRSVTMGGGMTAPSGASGGGAAPGMVPQMGGGMMSGMVGPPPPGGGGPSMMTGLSMGPGALGGGLSGPMAGASAGGSIAAQSQIPFSVPDEQVKETWVYTRGAHTFHFLFNMDGRVIKIQSFGTKGSGATSRAVGLGDSLSKVYKMYGWAGTTSKQGDALTLDYSQTAHVVFDLLDRRDGKGIRVVGISIAPSEGRR